ncbi:VOC family protein [Actinomadura opuntiae]|uniref:VOC family protein n=1 Tax=Actinomadura sp. OS1-43 TaxID=604315 RepID=UPI00255AF7C1|nr:VOC family protein [Actinomadura sp. OS1-43]MDL4816970.1 VOC family protein [Actinomadura sp. OS1-43]
MPEVTEYAPGMPTWAELATPDLGASTRFYSGLFGWSTYTVTVDTLGDYEMCTLGGPQGPQVAGMQPMDDDTLRPSWTCFFRTADIGGSAEAVRAAGGRELTGPVQVVHFGRMALFADPQGASFAVWEPDEHQGAEVAGEPSTLCWVELACRDVDRARAFYGAVFGWRAVDREYYGPTYTNFKIGDWAVAGMVRMDEQWPPHAVPHWTPYFEVADCDASAALAADLGARVRVPPSDIPPGRFAIMTDPAGARLGIIAPARRR